MPHLREKVINEPVITLVALQAIDDSLADNGVVVNVVDLGFFILDKNSTDDADNIFVVMTNSGTGRWLNISSFTGTTNTTLGGIPAGTVFDNKPIPALLKQALIPYLNPSFTSFAITGITIMEVGDKITSNQTFTWAISNVANVQANSLNITDVSNSLLLVPLHSITSPAIYDFTSYPGGGLEYDSPFTNLFRISAINTQSGVFTRDLNIPWYWRLFYGTSTNTSLNSAQILALSGSLLTSTSARTYNFAAGGYKYICVNETLPQPTSFKDQSTNLDIPFESAVLVSVTNTFGIVSNYNVYRSTNILGSAINIIVS